MTRLQFFLNEVRQGRVLLSLWDTSTGPLQMVSGQKTPGHPPPRHTHTNILYQLSTKIQVQFLKYISLPF